MNRLYIFICVICYTSYGYSIQVDVANYIFKSEKHYAEIYLRIDGTSILWTQKNNHQNAAISATLLLKNNAGEIVSFDKFTLSKFDADTITDLISVRRMYIQEGDFTLRAEFIDENDPDNKIELEQKLGKFSNSPFSISSIIPLNSFKSTQDTDPSTKNGYYLEALPYHYVESTKLSVDFYAECYMPADNASPIVLKYYLVKVGEKNGNIQIKAKKLKNNIIAPLILSMPSALYTSGDYEIHIELLDDKKNILATQQVDINISNPKADIAALENYNQDVENSFVNDIEESELEYILRAHVPIVDQIQSLTLEQLIDRGSIKSRRQFIYQFWKRKASKSPETSYKSYMEVAKAVDKKFYNAAGFGFQTDRGHIFLKHGKPQNVVTVETEVDAPPYEIWYYNGTATTRQTNVRFLFYNPSLGHNDFQLLHSTCYGERSNPSWERELYKNNPSGSKSNPIDNPTVEVATNRNARRYFNEF